jgi:hypothetical protein
MESSVQSLQRQYTQDVTWLHATFFFQFFVALIQFLLAPWYLVVMFSPGSISEYLPHEQTPSLLLVLRFVIAAAVWVPIMYFTWKRSRSGLIASAFYSVALLILVPTIILTAGGRPDFSDFAILPVDVLLAIFSVKSWTSSSKSGNRRRRESASLDPVRQ